MTRESPGAGSRASLRLAADQGTSSPLSLSPIGDIDEVRRIVDGGYVVIVRTTGGLPTRRVYLSLTGAERAVKRALDRGQNAVLVLAELRALYRVEAPDRRDDGTA